MLLMWERFIPNHMKTVSNEGHDVPDHVHLLVPGVEVQHGADADHVVSVLVRVLDVLVPDRHTGEQLETARRLLPHLFSSIETVHKQSSSPGSLVLEAVKHLNSARTKH